MKNSVYVLGHNLQDQGVSVQYRQSEFRASTRFWGAGLPAYDERPPFEDSACNITQQPMYGDWSAQFEEGPSTITGGFGVSATDFEAFYNSATCCGNSCPMSSTCRTYKVWAAECMALGMRGDGCNQRGGSCNQRGGSCNQRGGRELQSERGELAAIRGSCS